jgi:hypothetical protein
MNARTFADIGSALLNAYEEEVSGEAYFAALAEQHDGRAREALMLIAEMEVVTARLFRPVIDAAGLHPRSAEELVREGRDDAEALRGTSWTEFLASMRDGYDAYVTEFKGIRAAVKPDFRPHADLLIAHEVAIIDFARAELAGDGNSLSYLHRYLEEARSFA